LYLVPCYLAVVFAAWWLGSRLWRDPEAGRVCAMVCAASGLTLVASQAVSTDFPLAAVVALSQAAFWEAFRSRRPWAVYAFWLLTAVAFLTKGPPALLYLPAAIVTWLRLPREDRRQVRLFSPLALALFLLVGFSWYGWESWRNPGLLNYWVNDEVVNRSLSSKFHRNPEFYWNFVVYLPILLLATTPWNLLADRPLAHGLDSTCGAPEAGGAGSRGCRTRRSGWSGLWPFRLRCLPEQVQAAALSASAQRRHRGRPGSAVHYLLWPRRVVTAARCG
jgi:4-amino-4-deoxy-L-arabinose transferase-like glycosyltransferase